MRTHSLGRLLTAPGSATPLTSLASLASLTSLASLALLTAACSAAEGDPAPASRRAASASSASAALTPAAVGAAGPVVLELFTSQGCSSCPPADRLLGELVDSGALGDRAVIAMAFHVDYWNDLGWADPFSRAQWSQRQRQYADSLGEAGVYTPQLVIGGRAHVVGSDRRKLARAVEQAAVARPLSVTATWSPRAVQVRATGAVAGEELWVALWQDGLSTEIARGENRGESLRGDHVVRQLVRLGADGTATVAIDPAWATAARATSGAAPALRMGGAVLAHRGGDRAITAAAALPPPSAAPGR